MRVWRPPLCGVCVRGTRLRVVQEFVSFRFAARIATGAWKAKKHKAFAEEARRAWAQLKRDKVGRVWMQHVRHEDLDYLIAGGLARAGKNGRSEYSETVS